MGRFLIDVGDSNQGPIGMVVRLEASSTSEAIQIMRDALKLAAGHLGQVSLSVPCPFRESIDYVNIYVNPDAITEADVFDEDGP